MPRPALAIDLEMVQKLAAIGCTNREIASVLNISHDTLGRRCETELSNGREEGKMRLRKKQYEIGMSGNVTMLIWLGKNILGQSDKITNETVDKPTIVIHDNVGTIPKDAAEEIHSDTQEDRNEHV